MVTGSCARGRPPKRTLSNSLGNSKKSSRNCNGKQRKVARSEDGGIKRGMRLELRALVAVALLGVGCRTAHDVGETVSHVATAPINLVRHKPEEPANEAATTT